MKFSPWFVAAVVGVFLSAPASALFYRVTIDTAPLQGVAGFVALDFLAGDPVTGNAAVVRGFASDGVAGASASSGDVSGDLIPGPLTLGGGTQFFSEWLQTLSAFGSTISFELDLGAIVAAGGRADQFAFFLLDANQLPFETTDPTGAGALFFIDLAAAATTPVVFSSAFAVATLEPIIVNVPEPDSLVLMLVGVAVVGFGSRIGRRARRVEPRH